MIMTKLETEEWGFMNSSGTVFPTDTTEEADVLSEARILGLTPVVRVRTEYIVAPTIGEWSEVDA